MRRRGHLRNRLPWALVVISFLAVAAWTTSLWVGAGWSNGPRVGGVGTVELSAGGLVIGKYYSESNARRIASRTRPGFWLSAGAFRPPRWAAERRQFPSAYNVAYEFVTIPLWPAVLVACIAGAFACAMKVRARALLVDRRCPSCGYSRRGLAESANCPECGKPPAPK